MNRKNVTALVEAAMRGTGTRKPERTAPRKPVTATTKAFDDVIMKVTVSREPDFLAGLKQLRSMYADAQAMETVANDSVKKAVENATAEFKHIEKELDAHVKALRGFEHQHPEISGYDFDDLVTAVEALSDDVATMGDELADELAFQATRAAKTAGREATSVAREIATIFKSAAKSLNGTAVTRGAGGWSLEVDGFPLLVAVVKAKGSTATVRLEHTPQNDYEYEDSDYSAFSRAMQKISPVVTNSKVKYTDYGATADFVVSYDDISKFSTLFQSAVLGLFR